MSMTEWESKLSFNVQDVKILGRVGLGKKAAGYGGTWSATLHYNTSIFRKWVLNYKKTGVLQPFNVQVTNEDPSANMGRQTITHTGCIPEELILSKFVAGDELLDEEISGTFDDWDMPEVFAKSEFLSVVNVVSVLISSSTRISSI